MITVHTFTFPRMDEWRMDVHGTFPKELERRGASCEDVALKVNSCFSFCCFVAAAGLKST